MRKTNREAITPPGKDKMSNKAIKWRADIAAQNGCAVLRATEVCELTGLAYSTLYYHIRKGTFPKPMKLGKRTTGWLADDVKNWIASRRHGRAPIAAEEPAIAGGPAAEVKAGRAKKSGARVRYTRRALAEAHADITQELRWNEPGREPNLLRIAETLAKVLPVLGGFCGECSGTGNTWRGECKRCRGTGAPVDDEGFLL